MKSALSLEELASITECNHFAMLIRAYIDDSADQKRQHVAVAGCFLGSVESWDELPTPWRDRLKRDGLDYFRSSEYYSFTGEFACFRDHAKYPNPKGSEAAKALRDDLDRIIRRTAIVGAAVCIPMNEYNDIRNTIPDAARIFSVDPFETAFRSLVGLCAAAIKDRFHGDARIAFVCDDSSASERITRAYSQFKSDNLSEARIMNGLAHLDDKVFPQLQAADLCAHLAKEVFEDWLGTRPAKDEAALRERLQSVNISSIAYWNHEYMMHELDRERRRRRWRV
jgi:hypothetical protein